METRTRTLTLPELFVEEIDFINRDNVSISGVMRSGPGLIRAQFITDAEVLQTLLLHCGELGRDLLRKLQPIMERKRLPGRVDAPLEMSAKPICLQGCLIEISKGYFVNDEGTLCEDEEGNVFYIIGAQPKNPIPIRMLPKRKKHYTF
jgi:hypothetical protein